MAIIGKHITLTDFPQDTITNPVIVVIWDQPQEPVDIRIYIEGIDTGFKNHVTTTMYTRVLPLLDTESQKNYVLHIQTTDNLGENDTLSIPFTHKRSDTELQPIIEGFPRQFERTNFIAEPISQIRPAVFRGPADSKSHNTSAEEFYYDMMQLFYGAQQLESKIHQTQKIMEQQQKGFAESKDALDAKIKELESLIPSGISHVKTLRPSQALAGYPNIFQGVKPNKVSSFIDKEFGFISPAHSSMPASKTYLFDDVKQRIIVEDLVIDISDSAAYTKETPRIQAVDGCRSTYWMYEAHYPSTSSIQEELVDITIELPSDIADHDMVNFISVVPYPEGSIDIMDIQYQGADNVFRSIPSFPTVFNVLTQQHEADPVIGAFRQAFTFPEIEMNKVKVTLRQRQFSIIEGKKVFTLGLQDLGIFYVEYNKSPSVFHIPISIKLPPTHSTYEIQEIHPIFNYNPSQDENYKKWLDLELYKVSTGGNLTEVVLNTDISETSLILIGYLHTQPGVDFTPVLKGLEIKYATE